MIEWIIYASRILAAQNLETEISVFNYCFGPKYNKELLKICDWLSKIMGSLFVEDGYWNIYGRWHVWGKSRVRKANNLEVIW